MNVAHIYFVVVMLAQCVTTEAELSPVEWSASSSEQCGELGKPDLTGVLTTVAQMIKNTASSSSLPKSCMEIKESFPVSPSGYYTISIGTSGGAAVVYCNMDDLYPCPALEQTLKGIRDDYEMLSQNIRTDHGKIIDQNENVLDFHQYMPSCKAIIDKWPLSTTGWYKISMLPGELFEVYCYMEVYCGSAGWKRVAELDMNDPSQNCPSQLRLYSYNGTRACGRYSSDSASCTSSIFFSSAGYPFTQICGRVHGYQHGSTNALDITHGPPSDDINGAYVDGVSLTVGDPREHVWTFMAGSQENSVTNAGIYICPCSNGSTQTVPSVIGSDYFCESGNPDDILSLNTAYFTDSLWDGEQCGSLETACCAAPDLPWFHKVLSAPTTDSIELRVCSDQATDNEDATVFYYEIYVK